MSKKVVIISVVGLGVILAAGFLVKVQITSAPVGSMAANYVAKYPGATVGGIVKIPILIKLLSKGTT